jgi:hypothetical protein
MSLRKTGNVINYKQPLLCAMEYIASISADSAIKAHRNNPSVLSVIFPQSGKG